MATPTQIIAVRHSETEFNLAGRLQGHLDSPLTPLGQEQAKALAGRLALGRFDALYSSDLGRAMATAGEISKRTSLPISALATLRERSLGIFEGLTWDEIAEKHPDDLGSYRIDPEHAVPGGESLKQLYERTQTVFLEIAARHVGQKVIVVTHGGVLASLFRFVMGQPLADRRRAHLPNAALNLLYVTGENWTIRTWGDTSHYETLPQTD